MISGEMCFFFLLAVLEAKLFIRSVSSAIASSPGNGQVRITDYLWEEICHWRFLDSWTSHVPWWEEKARSLNVMLRDMVGDASYTRRQANNPLGTIGTHSKLDSTSPPKKMLAISNVIKATPEHVWDCWWMYWSTVK